MKVSVTGYCLGGKTASGLKARTGVAAADPDVLPMGSVIRLRATNGTTAHDGVYTILDTGGDIQGRRIDIHIPSCAEARRFGRRSMVADVIRKGWAPGSTDNIHRDSTYSRGHQTGKRRAAGSDPRDAADAPSAARR
jgi:3D (Asp-Asp-Asp) domain-containing protein